MFQHELLKAKNTMRIVGSLVGASLLSVNLIGCGYISSGGEYSIREGAPELAQAGTRRGKGTSAKIPSYAEQLKRAQTDAPVEVAANAAAVRTPAVKSDDLFTTKPFSPTETVTTASATDVGGIEAAKRGKLAQPFNPAAVEELPKSTAIELPKATAKNEQGLPRATGAESRGLPPAKLNADPEAAEAVDLSNDADEAVAPLEQVSKVSEAKEKLAKEKVVKELESAETSAETVTKVEDVAPKAEPKLPSAKVKDDLSDTEEAEKKVASATKAQLSPSVVSTAARSTSEGDCGKAEGEAERARSSVSEADQLFYYRRALRLCPNSPQYHLEIGKIYSTLGRKQDAEFEFRQVMEIEPKNSEAKSLLSALGR